MQSRCGWLAVGLRQVFEPGAFCRFGEVFAANESVGRPVRVEPTWSAASPAAAGVDGGCPGPGLVPRGLVVLFRRGADAERVQARTVLTRLGLNGRVVRPLCRPLVQQLMPVGPNSSRMTYAC